MNSRPVFLQGVFPFTGQGLDRPSALDASLSYVVPADRRAQLVYFRAGNTAPELVCVALLRDGQVMRLFPVGAKAHLHVQLAVVEDLFPATKLDIQVIAPADLRGQLFLDIGFLEVL